MRGLLTFALVWGGLGWFIINLLPIVHTYIYERERAYQKSYMYVGHMLFALAAIWLGGMLL